MNYSWAAALTLVIASNAYAQTNINDHLRISGFGTVSASTSDSAKPIFTYRDIDNHLCIDCDTTFGIQADWLMSDQFRTSVQLLKRPQDSFSDPEVEWAYLAYSYDNSVVKLGRVRIPLFMMSEYYYVSAAYPWARPPLDVYDNILGITHFDGISYEWSHIISDQTQIRLAPYYAMDTHYDYKLFGNDYTLYNDNNFGINIQLIQGDNTFHIAYLKTSATQKYQNVTVESDDLNLLSFGINYIWDDFNLSAEALLDENSFATWFAGVNYPLTNSIQPYIQYGQRRRMYDNNTYLAGVRYNFTPQLMLNLEWSYVTGSKTVRSGHFDIEQDPNDIDHNANVYTLSLSFLF